MFLQNVKDLKELAPISLKLLYQHLLHTVFTKQTSDIKEIENLVYGVTSDNKLYPIIITDDMIYDFLLTEKIAITTGVNNMMDTWAYFVFVGYSGIPQKVVSNFRTRLQAETEALFYGLFVVNERYKDIQKYRVVN